MKLRIIGPLLLCIVLLLPFNAMALMEISGDFSYDRQIYGAQRQNKLVSRTYAGSYALYFFNLTAIELNYSQSEEITTENNEILISNTGYSIISMQNKVKTTIYGIGIRQSLTHPKSFIRPVISLGYAKQFVRDGTDISIRNNSDGIVTVIQDATQKKRIDSVFAAFMLMFRISQGFSIKGSIRSVFPASHFNKAEDNLQYMAGLTWVF